MKLVDLGGGLYDVEVNGKKVGSVWQNGHDRSWRGSRLDGKPLRARAGFLSKEGAAEAVVDEPS